MLKIKLARFGRRGQPMYRIVVNEARDKRDGKYVAKVGHYFPQQQPKVLEIDLDAVKSWLAKGAQPTETVAALIERYKSGNPFPAKKKKLSKKAKAKLNAPKEEKPAPEKAEPAADKAEKVEEGAAKPEETKAEAEKEAAVQEKASQEETKPEVADKAEKAETKTEAK